MSKYHRDYLEPSEQEHRIQYLGESGYTADCLLALDAVLGSGVLPQKATIVSLRVNRGRRSIETEVEDHLFLLWDWGTFPVTIIPSGFASGYNGEGSKGFSLAICMLRGKGIPIEQVYVEELEFESIDNGNIPSPLRLKIKDKSESLPFPFPEWVNDTHKILLERGQLWKSYYWREHKTDWLTEAIADIDDYDPSVGEKLRLALDLLLSSDGSAQCQQTGILIRDAWIELSRRLWEAAQNIEKVSVGRNDVKGMLGRLKISDEMINMTKSAYNLALKIQHDMQANPTVARLCLTATVLTMRILVKK